MIFAPHECGTRRINRGLTTPAAYAGPQERAEADVRARQRFSATRPPGGRVACGYIADTTGVVRLDLDCLAEAVQRVARTDAASPPHPILGSGAT